MTNETLKEFEDKIILLFTTVALGREGMAPLGAMTSEGKAALESLISKGEVVALPSSELDKFNADTQYGKPRYGLAGRKYPMTLDEFGDFRDSGMSTKMTYDEFVDGKTSGEIDVAQVDEDIKQFREDINKEFTDCTGGELKDFVSSNLGDKINMTAMVQIGFGSDKSPREVLVKIISKYSTLENKNMECECLYDFVLENKSNKKGLISYREAAVLTLADIDEEIALGK